MQNVCRDKSHRLEMPLDGASDACNMACVTHHQMYKQQPWCFADGASSSVGAEDEEVPDWGQEKSGKPPLKLGKVHIRRIPTWIIPLALQLQFVRCKQCGVFIGVRNLCAWKFFWMHRLLEMMAM